MNLFYKESKSKKKYIYFFSLFFPFLFNFFFGGEGGRGAVLVNFVLKSIKRSKSKIKKSFFTGEGGGAGLEFVIFFYKASK